MTKRLLAALTAFSLALGGAACAATDAGDRPQPSIGDPRPPPQAGDPEARPPEGGNGQRAQILPAYGLTRVASRSIPASDLDLLRQGGIRLYRFGMAMSEKRPTPRKRIGNYDRLVTEAARRGIDLLPVLLVVKAGRTRPPRTAGELRQWRRGVRAYVTRYGPGGSFWKENPGVPYRPIRAWEVWNEPNAARFWGRRRPDPGGYRRVLRTARATLRAVDPMARVVMAGLLWEQNGGKFLDRVLEGGAGCLVDAIAVHPYAADARRAAANVGEARSIADAKGARGAQLWVTEIGWGVLGGRRYRVPDAETQAARLEVFTRRVAARGARWRLGPIVAFALRDRTPLPAERADFRSGLREFDDDPRPGWDLWSRLAESSLPRPLPPARGCPDGEA